MINVLFFARKQGFPKLMAVNSSALEWGQEKAVTQALPGAIQNCSSLFLVLKITTASISKDWFNLSKVFYGLLWSIPPKMDMQFTKPVWVVSGQYLFGGCHS